jgi:phosphoadenosine phosphosulfate reductase
MLASAAPTSADRPAEAEARISSGRYDDLPAAALVSVMLRQVFRGRIALVSSFGTESAVLLDLVAEVDPTTPVLFLDTGKLFAKTLRYRDALKARLGLTDVRVLHPSARSLEEEDGGGELWRIDTDRCCYLRKVMPLTAGLDGFDAWITGRKCFHGGERGRLSTIETDAGGKTKINPLANWTPADITTYFANRNLPSHEMEADGYRSIGCIPCTDRANAWEEPRAGRWRHTHKTECGIHGRLSNTDSGDPPTREQ